MHLIPAGILVLAAHLGLTIAHPAPGLSPTTHRVDTLDFGREMADKRDKILERDHMHIAKRQDDESGNPTPSITVPPSTPAPSPTAPAQYGSYGSYGNYGTYANYGQYRVSIVEPARA